MGFTDWGGTGFLRWLGASLTLLGGLSCGAATSPPLPPQLATRAATSWSVGERRRPPEPLALGDDESFELEWADVPGAAGQQADRFPDINQRPIQVWVYRRADGAPTRVRVTGHAEEAVCLQATASITDFARGASLSDDSVASFGVADLAPGPDVAGFERGARVLVDSLVALARAHPDAVLVEFIEGAPRDDGSVAPPVLLGAPHPVVGRRVRLARAHGPAFVPLRTWGGGEEAPRPLRWRVSARELGFDPRLWGRITNARAVSANQGVVAHNAAMPAGHRASADLLRRHRTTTPQGLRSRAPATVGEVTLAIAQLRDALAFMAEMEAAGIVRFPERNHRSMEGALRRDESCLAALQASRRCEQYVAVFYRAPAAVDADALRHESEAERIGGVVAQQAQRQQGAVALSVIDAQAAIDATLRGWPLASSDPGLTQRVAALLRGELPRWWERHFAALRASERVDLTEPGSVMGVLQRGNVFFRVRALDGDAFEVTPTYVASGEFEEIWDLPRRRVMIALPPQ